MNMNDWYKNLPEKLSKTEEKNLIAIFDEKSKKILIERNLRLVIKIASQFTSYGVDIEDLTSIGTIGLIKGVNAFDPKRDSSFSTYIGNKIKYEIFRYFRANKKRFENEILNSEVFNADSYDDIDSTENINLKVTLSKEIERRLTNKEKKVITLRYNFDTNEELTQYQVANILGVSQASVYQNEKRAFIKLRKMIL